MPHVQDKSFVRSDVSVYLFCEHQKRPVNIVNWSTNCAYFPYLLNLNKARDMVQLALGMQCHCLALIRHDSCNSKKTSSQVGHIFFEFDQRTFDKQYLGVFSQMSAT
ncbi:hypothetical protein M513_00324 [Trichuris suis]|nr:hypothetical protein M513_00324 [Trichuris suis]